MIAIVTCAAALLLSVAGLAKVRSPAPATRMLAGLAGRAPLGRSAALQGFVRVAGVGEAVVGVLVLARGDRGPALLLAGCYAVFVAVSLRTLVVARRDRNVPRSSCGCFGTADSPIGVAHLLLTASGLAAAGAAVARPFGAAAGLTTSSASVAVTGALQVGVLAGLGYLSITSLPALIAARRLTEAR